jgi:SAM-dependent MidA family methyltransferase
VSRSLKAWIEVRGGRVTFRDFMAAALYDPDFGYYSRNIRDVGARGDFSTAATLDRTLLGSAIARWIRTEWMGARLPRNLIEIGAGDGSLARSVLRALGIFGRRGTRYHIVDVSPPLVARQRDALSGHRTVTWHAEVGAALEACGGEAILFSNELVDAFPATLYRFEDGWNEVLLTIEAGLVALTGDPAQDFQPEGSWTRGQIVESHASYREWLQSWEKGWKRGSLLTIDYGGEFPALYHRRPRGTLRAYFLRQRFEIMEEILARFGKQDLTCDVNFSDLRAWGEACGWRTDFLETQRDFLRRFGAVRQPNAAQAYLLDEEGAGGAFRVLAQSREG